MESVDQWPIEISYSSLRNTEAVYAWKQRPTTRKTTHPWKLSRKLVGFLLQWGEGHTPWRTWVSRISEVDLRKPVFWRFVRILPQIKNTFIHRHVPFIWFWSNLTRWFDTMIIQWFAKFFIFNKKDVYVKFQFIKFQFIFRLCIPQLHLGVFFNCISFHIQD